MLSNKNGFGRSKFRAWLRRFILAGLFLITLCVSVFSQGELVRGQQESTFHIFPQRSSTWESTQIPVCWENPNENFSTEMNWVRGAIRDSWESASVVGFSGWGACGNNSRGIRIQINDEGPHTKGLGSQLDGVRNGMVLNFTFQNWDQSCQSDRERCIRLIAVHEFGHALSFAHEQNRPDTPRWCQDRQGGDGDYVIGPWDLDSVMNYCNPRWSGDGKLSQRDIQGVQQLYGARLQNRLYIRPFDGRTFGPVISTQTVSSSDGFRGWSWNGTTASYVTVENGQNRLYIRPFDGRTFGPVSSTQVVSSSDGFRGWSWNGTTASYVAVDGNRKSILYVRPFDGRTLGPVSSTQVVSGADRLRGWSWDSTTASYVVKYP